MDEFEKKDLGEGEGADACAEENLSDTESVAEYEPKSRYEAFIYRIYRDETLSEIMKILSYVIVFATAYALFMRICALIDTPIEIVKLLSVLGVPFVTVSVIRSVINAPRPYELYGFYEK